MIEIQPSVKNNMIMDAEKTFPDECCGFIIGDGVKQEINLAIPVHNAKEGDKRRRFEISPGDYLKAEQLADEKGLVLLGVYHSHPNHPSIPSEMDRLAAQPNFSYIILSVMNGSFASMQSWKLNEQSQFEEEIIFSH